MRTQLFHTLRLAFFLLTGWAAQAQMRELLPTPGDLAATITAAELERHLYILAAPEMEGRETGTEGQRKAAAYLAEVMADMGLTPVGDNGSYLQSILLKSEGWQKTELSIHDKKYRHLWDYYALPAMQSQERAELNFTEVLFLGYGIEEEGYSDYQNVDVRNKAILIYDGEPTDEAGNSYLKQNMGATWTTERKLALAAAKGVALVLVIDSRFKENVAEARRLLNGNRLKPSVITTANYAPAIFLSSETAKALLDKKLSKVIKQRDKIRKTGRPAGSVIPVSMSLTLFKDTRSLSGHNVMGLVEGIDPVLKDEVLVVSAHFDHLGRRGDAIYHGADDNASGTSAVLEIAQAFAEAKRSGAGPRRSVLFLLVSGEEKGLLGSQYYVNFPAFPLERTIANVNVDMIGRVDSKHSQNPNYIYIIGADRLSTELHQINETANATYTRLELDYTYNARNDPNRFYYRSDHYNFAERGIPAIFYFSGTHEDYHRTTDTADKINYQKMAPIARLIFHTAWELTNRDKRIVVDVKE